MPVVQQNSNQGKGKPNSNIPKNTTPQTGISDKFKVIIIAIVVIAGIVFYIEYKDSKKKDEEYKQEQLAIQEKAIADEIKAKAIAKAKQDSIANEALKYETFQNAHIYVENFGQEYMKAVTPSSGENLTWQIDTTQSSFNDVTKTMTIIFNLHWKGYTAATGGLFEDYKKDLEYTGRLLIYKDKSKEFQAITKNSALTVAEDNSTFMKNLGDKTLEKVIESAMSSN